MRDVAKVTASLAKRGADGVLTAGIRVCAVASGREEGPTNHGQRTRLRLLRPRGTRTWSWRYFGCWALCPAGSFPGVLALTAIVFVLLWRTLDRFRRTLSSGSP